MPEPEPVDAGLTAVRIRGLLADGFTVRRIARAARRPEQVIAVVYFLRLISPATAEAVERAEKQLRRWA